MVLQIITILALLTSNTVMCMDNNNNVKEEQEYDSGGEVKINEEVTDEQIEKFLQYKKNNGSLQRDAATYIHFVEQHYPQLKLDPQLKKQNSGKRNTMPFSAAEQFKEAVVKKSLSKLGKTESMSSADYLKSSEYGTQNAGQ